MAPYYWKQYYDQIKVDAFLSRYANIDIRVLRGKDYLTITEKILLAEAVHDLLEVEFQSDPKK